MINDLEFSRGNHKLGTDTLIFNMGPAETCPSMKNGMCNANKSGAKCYALKAEQCYGKKVVEYRKRQQKYWNNKALIDILGSTINKLRNEKIKTKYLRFNESGDFNSQDDVNKLSRLARILKMLDITVYGYTSRSDLDYSNVNFLVKGSGFYKPGMTGKTIILNKNDKLPKNYFECKNDCRICNACKISKKINIAFRKH